MDKKQIIDLWQSCFHDTKAFTDLYFENIYQEGNTLVKEKNGKLLSALQMLPYTLAYGGKEIPVSYISGASTYPEFRGKGLMQSLMQDAFREMQRRGMLLSVLIPAERWLFGFYHKTGYAEAMYYKKVLCPPGKSAVVLPAAYSIERLTGRLFSEKETVCTPQVLYAYFNRVMQNRSYSIRHTFKDFEIILRDLIGSEGDLFVVSDNTGEIRALAFVYPTDDNEMILKEVLALDPDTVQFVLNHIPSYYLGTTVVYKQNSPSGIPYGMARVIDAEAMLKLYASLHPELTLAVDLKDPLLPHNTGYYLLEDGKCRKFSSAPEKPAVLTFTPPELAALLFSGQSVYLTLMLD